MSLMRTCDRCGANLTAWDIGQHHPGCPNDIKPSDSLKATVWASAYILFAISLGWAVAAVFAMLSR